MIVQRINDATQVIFTNNKASDLNMIGSELGYLRKDGTFYKSVYVNTASEYRPQGASNFIQATQLQYKGVVTYIINDTHEFTFNTTNIPSIIENLNTFGSSYKLKINDMEFSTLISDGTKLKTIDGTTISINSESTQDTTNISNFIHRMAMDNGRMLYPVIKRFINTLLMFRGHKSTLTGYVNLKNYLYTIKIPSNGIFNGTSNKSSTYNITLNSEMTSLEIIDVTNGIPTIKLNLNGSLHSNLNTGKFDPYILFTSTPIQMKNQRMPYKIVNYRGVTVFITPLLFNNSETLNTLRGGINLLS